MTTDNKDKKPDVEYTTDWEGQKVNYKVYVTATKVEKNKPKDKEI